MSSDSGSDARRFEKSNLLNSVELTSLGEFRKVMLIV